MKRIAIIGIILFSTFIITYGQDVAFSQFYNSPLFLNPAFTGVNGGPRLTAVYRNQWPGLGTSFSTYFASYDQYFDLLNGGVGAMATSDVQGGLYLTNSLTGLYAYNIQINQKYTVNIGVQAAFVQKRIETDKLIFADNINSGNGSTNQIPSMDLPDRTSRSFADFGAGALFYSDKLFAGIAAKHLSQPDQSFYTSSPERLPIRYDVTAGYEFQGGSYQNPTYVTPNIMYSQQSYFKQITGGAILGINVFYAGLYYRYALGVKGSKSQEDSLNLRSGNSDSFILLVGLHKGVFKFGYSYDLPTNGLTGSGGSHELSITLNFYDSKRSLQRINNKKVTQCPNLF